MSEYEKTKCARALLYWAKNNNGHEVYYLEDRMYAVADGDMVIILTADSYDEAKRKAKARTTEERPKGEWEEPFEMNGKSYHKCNRCHISSQLILIDNFCPNCGADMRTKKIQVPSCLTDTERHEELLERYKEE